jgi:hypothetical protein
LGELATSGNVPSTVTVVPLAGTPRAILRYQASPASAAGNRLVQLNCDGSLGNAATAMVGASKRA